MKHIIPIVFLTLLCFGLKAQENHPAKGLHIPMEEVGIITMPEINNEILTEQELALPRKGRAVHFAHPFDVSITPETHGTWETLPDGRSVWRLRVVSNGALSLNFGFTEYRMPEGGKLFIYTMDRRNIMGPFSPADNEEHNQLWTPIIEVDECVVEVVVPESEKENLGIKIGKINHGFLDMALLMSGSCNLDVICGAADGFPDVDDNRDIIRSAATYSLNGIATCSGALINTANEECTPYFLTADHCGVSAGNAPSIVVYWNYENSECRQPNSAASGQPGDGVQNTFNSGSVRRATYGNSDFTLVELDDPVEETANAHFAGWSREDLVPTTSIGIHHPNLEEKRISFEYDNEHIITSYGGDNSSPNGTHIRVTDWDVGTTEGGSSGSPLFDQNKRIVGQLTGGGAACGNDAPDWYGRMTTNWEGGGSANSRLKDWLDPTGTDVMFVDGRDVIACGFAVVAVPFSQEVCASADVTYNLEVSDNFIAPVNMTLTGLPANANATFSSNPAMPGENVTLTITTSGVATGEYNMMIENNDGTENSNTMLRLSVFDGIPTVPALVEPADGAVDAAVSPTFEWNGATMGTNYDIEVASDVGFSTIVATGNIEDSNAFVGSILLESLTTYYWRVKGANICGETAWSSVFSFTTADVVCGDASNNEPVNISGGLPSTNTSTINFPTEGTIADVNILNIIGEHTYLEDLTFSITSPAGTIVQLVSGACEDNEDFNISFDDNAASSSFPCPYNDGGTYQPIGNLSDFNGEQAQGTWTLTIQDAAFQDGGALMGWDLQICLTGVNVSNEDLAGPDFNIFPNPNSGAFSIILPELPTQAVQGKVLSVDGKTITTFSLESHRKDLNLGALPKGFYLIQLVDEKGSRTEKLQIH